MEGYRKFNDIMLDIETMGTDSFSSIISIGALEFDIETGDTGKEFYVNIDLQSCIDSGLTISAGTVMWWLQQNEQARKDLVDRKVVHIKTALLMFDAFCDKKHNVWGNSARFDCGLLQNAYNKVALPIPWNYWNERCVRTLVSLKPEIKKSYIFKGTAHNALHDCYHQVGYCSEIWKQLKQKNGLE
jgi:DNA polymerase III epsilon subunit-like protein